MLAYTAVIPAFNAERTIEDCLNSVLGQGCLPREIIVVDDGSNDRTVAIVEAVASRGSPHPFACCSSPTRGRAVPPRLVFVPPVAR